jgi:cytochrome c oxidase subunit 3
MSVAAMFALIAVGIAGWWLFVRQLMAKPWERKQSESDDKFDGAAVALPPSRVGLWLFLAVITSFFGLFISAYSMRMELPDWRPFAKPGILWVNTALLLLSSFAFETARGATKRGDARKVKIGLVAAGLLAFAFLAGQWAAWNELHSTGQFPSSNAAFAFFCLLTGLHGLHLLGGLFVWAKTTTRMFVRHAKVDDVRMSVELCAVYWHYLLLVWLVLFGILLST